MSYSSAISILDTFSELDTNQARALPPFRFTQVAHACVSLMRWHLAATTDPEVGKSAILNASVIEEHVAKAVRRFGHPSFDGNSLPGEAFQKMMAMLQTRYQDAKKTTGDGAPSAKLEGSAAGNQALHLLSEVAMKNSGQVEDSKGQKGTIAAESDVQHATDALCQKLLGIGNKDLLDDRWFEELVLHF